MSGRSDARAVKSSIRSTGVLAGALAGARSGACVRPSVPALPAAVSARTASAPTPPTSAAPLVGPPPPGVPPDTPLPPLRRERLNNGLAITMLNRGGVPLVALELALSVGRAGDGARPGTAVVCSELWRERLGRESQDLLPELSVELDQTRYSYLVASNELVPGGRSARAARDQDPGIAPSVRAGSTAMGAKDAGPRGAGWRLGHARLPLRPPLPPAGGTAWVRRHAGLGRRAPSAHSPGLRAAFRLSLRARPSDAGGGG